MIRFRLMHLQLYMRLCLLVVSVLSFSSFGNSKGFISSLCTQTPFSCLFGENWWHLIFSQQIIFSSIKF
ncbi:hypothetical protein QVD17_32592 [Tagetes erecta]|uniref:Secreted protein n=1 Tax=Tagetes erecta TaxID=13708 RepID=A0AAD8NKV1_TARER|nr:hypothetical protein QVD17_32592 [Tagetes erecta]